VYSNGISEYIQGTEGTTNSFLNNIKIRRNLIASGIFVLLFQIQADPDTG
jgi:hypothetical protein